LGSGCAGNGAVTTADPSLLVPGLPPKKWRAFLIV
jgi:hypothetical protein